MAIQKKNLENDCPLGDALTKEGFVGVEVFDAFSTFKDEDANEYKIHHLDRLCIWLGRYYLYANGERSMPTLPLLVLDLENETLEIK